MKANKKYNPKVKAIFKSKNFSGVDNFIFILKILNRDNKNMSHIKNLPFSVSLKNSESK
jgi:hypothetical protein